MTEPIKPIPWPREVPPRVLGWTEAEPYSVLEFRLDKARDQEEVNYPGDNITVATNGSLGGISVKFQSKRNKSIPLDQFNPISYPSGFDKFYLTNSIQTDSVKLYIFIGRAAGAAAPTVSFAASQIVKVSGQTIIVASGPHVMVSGQAAPIYGYDYLSGEWRAVYVDASGEIKIAVTVADIVIAKISGETVKVSGEAAPIYGYYALSGDQREVHVDASGEIKIHVTVADIVTAKISGETVVVASGAYVQVSGQMVEVASGQTVIAKVSGEIVSVASGAYVQVSGQMIAVASGAFVQVSGQMIAVASGAFVLISGQQVIAKVSGEVAKVVAPTTLRPGYAQISAASGGTALSSGQIVVVNIRSLPGNNMMWLGGETGLRSGEGYLLLGGEEKTIEINNLNVVHIYPENSGEYVSYIGMAE